MHVCNNNDHKASIINGIPKNFQVVELDTQDGKNVFYLPKGTGNLDFKIKNLMYSIISNYYVYYNN